MAPAWGPILVWDVVVVVDFLISFSYTLAPRKGARDRPCPVPPSGAGRRGVRRPHHHATAARHVASVHRLLSALHPRRRFPPPVSGRRPGAWPPCSEDPRESGDRRRPFRLRHRDQSRLLQPHRLGPRSAPTALIRTHTSTNDDAPYCHTPTGIEQPANRNLRPASAAPLPPSTTAITLTTDLRMHTRDRKFRTLDRRLRVRMPTGWVHEHAGERSTSHIR
jgi:hypothetical protein